MDNLIFCLNATVPIFLTMILGGFFRKAGLMDESFVNKLNAFVFKICLPVLLFKDLATVDFVAEWDGKFVAFCFLCTLITIAAVAALSFLLKDRSTQGEFVQAAYRSAAGTLGIAFIQNIYGSTAITPLMIISTVPLYNAMAVVVLSLMKPERGKFDRKLLLKTLRGIITNPIILGILAGMVWSLLRIPMPYILQKTALNISGLATTLGLIAMGASFDISRVSKKRNLTIAATAIKLVVIAAIFLPIAIRMGFTDEKMVAILIMLASPTTVSCYIMARNMGHEGTLTSGAVMLSTFLSAFTLTGWLYLLRVLALI